MTIKAKPIPEGEEMDKMEDENAESGSSLAVSTEPKSGPSGETDKAT